MSQTYHHGALREALLAASETILENNGVAGLTLRAAARQAGVSHAAPAHHFRNLSGLLSELAAAGFNRLSRHLVKGLAADEDEVQRKTALSRGYIEFARASPGLFSLMFRSDQLDWTNPNLAAAGGAAFEVLLNRPKVETEQMSVPLPQLTEGMAQWSKVHGLAMLLIDGRLGAAVSLFAPEVGAERLLEEILRSGAS